MDVMRIPTWKEKQTLLFKQKNASSKTSLESYAKSCLEKGLLQDALEYASHAQSDPVIQDIIEHAVEMGDFFILNQVKKSFPALLSQEQWNKAKSQAQQLGKTIFASQFTEPATQDA